ncbi:MAG TPA: S8 family serine peptidase [Streptosporangiaceae bacterium]
MAVLGVLGSGPAFGATTTAAAAGNAVRGQEWWLTGLHVTQAWQKSEGAGIIVAVLGTGVAADHPDLAGDVITGPDYSESGRTPGSSYWGVEGTAVAGIIAGHGLDGNWGIGIVGVAPAAKILSVRVTLEFNDPLVSDRAISRRLPDAIADGIVYAVSHGARVIDLPLDPGTLGLTGNGDPAAGGGSTAERAAVGYALRKNVVLVAPAGDDGQGPGIVNYPAAYPGVIAVGAIGRTGHLAAFSSRRSHVSLTAPGVRLVTATPPDGYGQISSTSTASGIVAGVAALILSKFPQLTVAQVTRALIESTVPAGGGTSLPPQPGRSQAGAGYGTVDAARTLEMAALISSADQVRQPAVPTSRPSKLTPRAVASPHRASARALAGSVLRDAVAALGGLIVVVVVALLIARSRRGRPAAPGRARARGHHAHRRPDRAPAGPVTPTPGAAGYARSRTAEPALGAANGWPSAAGWPGGGPGEIGHPSWPAETTPPAPPARARPTLTSAPRTIAGYRASRSAAAQAGSAGPPWDPAPAPGRMIGPLPVASASSPPPEPGPGIRVPGDMAVPPGATADSPPPDDATQTASYGLSTPPAGFDLSTPAFGLTPPAFDVAPPGPDAPRSESLGFAAAPVPTDYAMPPPAELGPAEDSVPVAPADPSYIWDLAATDVFPAAGPGQPAETTEVLDAVPPDAASPDAGPPNAGPPPPDDTSGDGGS